MVVTSLPRDASVLCINTGSSSLKAAWFEGGGSITRCELRLDASTALSDAIDAAAERLLGPGSVPDVIGHRVVHGGPDLFLPTIVDDDVIDRLRDLAKFAPLHQPAAISAIEHLRDRMASVPQVACFDTAFHRRLPYTAQRLPLPERYWEEGIRRYGFHGLSYEYVIGHFGARLGNRCIVAHLGSGASLVALRDGAPVDTTMSLTPGGGLVMATRSGELDPGVVLQLLALESGAERVAAVLEQESGMLGLSGSTGDARALLERAPDDRDARLAIDAFVTGVAKYIGAFTTVLGGLDTLVFTGGIGRGSAEIRSAIAGRLAHLGVDLSATENQRGAERISPPDARCAVFVVATDEEAVIAAHARDALRAPRR